MLIFNEGVPGAGKTYDAVVEHILPALRKGRTVYARVNGLDADAIAPHVGRPAEEVRELLIHVRTADVVDAFVAERDDDGEFTIPAKFRNALIVIDEVHEFYVASREPLRKEVEQFYAIHRHYGMDIVVMTQWYKRLHTAMRARIERKNVFQKLTAVSMENHYRVTFWSTVAPDKYEKTGGETRKYKPEFFACYKGVASGEVNTQVYDAGSKSVWKTLLVPSIIMAVILGFAVVMLYRFFTGKAEMVEGQGEQAVAVSAPTRINDATPRPRGEVYQPQASAQPVPVKPPPKADPIDKMTPEQAYIWRIAKTARARAAARMGDGAHVWGLIEFRERNQPPVEVISTRHLQAMGIEVEAKPYGFLLKAGGEAIVATAWPTNEPQRPPSHELYRLDKGRDGSPEAIASNASDALGRTQGALSINNDDAFQTRYGAFRGQDLAM